MKSLLDSWFTHSLRPPYYHEHHHKVQPIWWWRLGWLSLSWWVWRGIR
jgi:hypothetical protein